MQNVLIKQRVMVVLVAAFLFYAAGAAFAKEKPDVKSQFVPLEILVKFTLQAHEIEKSEVRQHLNATLMGVVKSIQMEYWQLPVDLDTMKAVDLLNGMSMVEFAEPNYLYAPQLFPNDPDFDQLWYLDNIGQNINGTTGTLGADISVLSAWDVETGSHDIVIAVIDSGVAFDHPDLSNNIWSNPGEIPDNGIDDDGNGYVDDIHGWDFVNQDNNPSDYSKDLYGDGHGTHVAGIIAAEGDNLIGTVGVMWHAKIMPLQIFDLFEDSPFNATTINIIRAVEYATDNGADIINCSFGGPSFSVFQKSIYERADENKILIVAAAGNDGQNNDSFPTYPAGYDLENIIAVAATDDSDDLASYSNFGKVSVDVAAPGGNSSISNIYSTTPPKRVTMFEDDFEATDVKWLTSGIHEDWSVIFVPDASSNAVTDSIDLYHENESSYIRTTQMIPASNFRGLNLQFSILNQLEPNYDFLNVEISEDDIEYTLIHSITGISDGWERVIIWSNDVAPDDFFLRFRLTSDYSNNDDGVFLDDISLSGIDWKFTGDEYGYKSGTSMATPVVSGIAGLIWSANPALTHLEVKQMIIETVDPVDDLDGTILSGGRVNAHAAVLSATALLTPDSKPDDQPDTKPNDETDTGPDGGDDSGCFISTILH